MCQSSLHRGCVVFELTLKDKSDMWHPWHLKVYSLQKCLNISTYKMLAYHRNVNGTLCLKGSQCNNVSGKFALSCLLVFLSYSESWHQPSDMVLWTFSFFLYLLSLNRCPEAADKNWLLEIYSFAETETSHFGLVFK